jgi:hypothetical protein
VNHARWDLCGGCSAMGIPTAIGTVVPYLDAETWPRNLRTEVRLYFANDPGGSVDQLIDAEEARLDAYLRSVPDALAPFGLEA